MNVEFPLVGDTEIDEKIKEWQQWDEVLCKMASYKSRSFLTNMWYCILFNFDHIFIKLAACRIILGTLRSLLVNKCFSLYFTLTNIQIFVYCKK
jgi:hypothetical protein